MDDAIISKNLNRENMSIDRLVMNDFRNILAATIEPLPGVNVFFGKNGSGKTSILEAIYFLGLGRSFRTHLAHRIIHHDANHFLLFASLNQSGQVVPVGVERFRSGEKKIRLGGETLTSLALLAKKLPLQLLTPDSHRYFHDGPKLRRQFLDWGVFHVEQLFYLQWQDFNKALKQRNAGLKQQLPLGEMSIWDNEIIKSAALFDHYRKTYIAQLQPLLIDLLQSFLPSTDLHLRYYRGWSHERELAEVLIANLTRDQQLGYTQSGPQRADLQLYAGKVPAADHLSQGQQKLAAYALHLAQGVLMQKLTNQSPIYLIDDLPSELDTEKRRLVADVLAKLQAQVFITGITIPELEDMVCINQARTFHVKHGVLEECGPGGVG